MLDPKLIKEKPEIIRNMLKARAVEFDLDELVESDQKRRVLQAYQSATLSLSVSILSIKKHE